MQSSKNRISGGAPTAPGSPGKPRFRPVHLTNKQLNKYNDQAYEQLMATINNYVKLDGSTVDSKRWRYMRTREGVTVFRDSRPLSSGVGSLLSAGTMKASFHDVMEGFYADTSEDSRTMLHMINKRFTDAEILKVVERRTEEQPYGFTGIKWALLRAPGGGNIIPNRDICFLDKTGTVELDNGRKFGYFLVQSLDVPECPPFTTSKLVRAQISFCYVVEELQPNLVGVYMQGTMDSRAPNLFAKVAIKSFADIALSVCNTVNVTRAKRFSRLQSTIPRFSRQPKSKVCQICFLAPGFFESMDGCAGCNKTCVCKRCRQKCNTFRVEGKNPHFVRAEFCQECVDRVIAGPQKQKELKTTKSVSSRKFSEPPAAEPEDPFASSFATVSEDSASEYAESHRQMLMFSSRIATQLNALGHGNLNSRLSQLSAIGAGEVARFVAVPDEEDEDEDAEIGILADDFVEGEEIIEVQPLRRSQQPPELLAGEDYRKPQHAGMHSSGHQQELFSRLVQVSNQAEQTFRITKEQTKIAHKLRDLGQH
ncbi:hypothetical protein Poli38472_000343 [Pythium oligandrum]|uniref:FYVE-type domain-containing protein n=1 Tax=Pythium oligandrum TaxID=41045 RepID=A0A8K1FF91_PYTOL|nr:hypothetical protein Poli38472_000343 [Pythium oligandrum]|eukprot:TMW60301.1 hypothetical protein Poli38472_000343 [Pythium oligandrum]